MPGPSFKGRTARSSQASAAARGASRKRDTKCELVLRRALWVAGLRYRKDVAKLPGRPDIVFARERIAVFCDGDFWHGRDWEARKEKLSSGHNAPYWVAKIERNIKRDRERDRVLSDAGWLVLRFWETDILANVDAIADRVAQEVALRQDSRE